MISRSIDRLCCCSSRSRCCCCCCSRCVVGVSLLSALVVCECVVASCSILHPRLRPRGAWSAAGTCPALARASTPRAATRRQPPPFGAPTHELLVPWQEASSRSGPRRRPRLQERFARLLLEHDRSRFRVLIARVPHRCCCRRSLHRGSFAIRARGCEPPTVGVSPIQQHHGCNRGPAAHSYGGITQRGACGAHERRLVLMCAGVCVCVCVCVCSFITADVLDLFDDTSDTLIESFVNLKLSEVFDEATTITMIAQALKQWKGLSVVHAARKAVALGFTNKQFGILCAFGTTRCSISMSRHRHRRRRRRRRARSSAERHRDAQSNSADLASPHETATPLMCIATSSFTIHTAPTCGRLSSNVASPASPSTKQRPTYLALNRCCPV